MDVVVYALRDCRRSAVIKELLAEKGVAYREEPLLDSLVPRRSTLAAALDPITVINGEAVTGLDRVRIEQLIGWHGI